MTDSKKLSGDDTERFILPDGKVLTREQMEAMLKKKAATGDPSGERAEAQLELARFYLSIAKPLHAYRILKTILASVQPPERYEICKKLLELIRGNRQAPPSERASEQHAEMLIRLGRAFRKNRLTAWDYLRKAASLTKSQDKMAECYLDLGRLSEQDENYEEAVRYYSLAFTMPEGSDKTWYYLNNNLGYSLARLERYAEAEACCRRAIAINPFQYNAHKNLGLSLRGQGRFLDAATSFLIASMSNPDEGRAMGHLGEMLADNPELRQGIFETLRDRLETQAPPQRRVRPRESRRTN